MNTTPEAHSGVNSSEIDHLGYLSLGIDQAGKWFEVHASQRLTLLNVYISLLAVSFGFMITQADEMSNAGLILAGLALLVFSITFKLVDRRIAYLIKSAEWSLDLLQEEIQDRTNIEAVRIVKKVNDRNQISLRICFNVLFFTGLIVAAILLSYGINSYLVDKCK